METVNMHEAKTRLSQLVAKAGRPVARVTAIDAPEPGKTRRLGFMKGHLSVPEDFDRMGEAEIATLFGNDS